MSVTGMIEGLLSRVADLEARLENQGDEIACLCERVKTLEGRRGTTGVETVSCKAPKAGYQARHDPDPKGFIRSICTALGAPLFAPRAHPEALFVPPPYNARKAT